jgi:outer membrane immunogenic protein
MKYLLAGIIALFALATINAAVAKSPPPPPPPVYHWTGFYVGANVGYGWGNSTVNYSPNDPSSACLFGANGCTGAPPPATPFNTSGVLGGVQFGYTWQLNRNWLAGIETDFDWSGINGSGSSVSSPFGLSATTTANERINFFGTVRGRLGILPMESLFTYVTGGFAYGQVAHTASYINTSGVTYGANGAPFGVDCIDGAPTYMTGSSTGMATGWTVGAGSEFAISNLVKSKVEYLYLSCKAVRLLKRQEHSAAAVACSRPLMRATVERLLVLLALDWTMGSSP